MLGKIAWKNIVQKPLNTALCVSLLLFGVGIISLLLLIQQQLEQKFERDLQGIDLVVGAKGSPLQLVLSAVYHLDAPTGNIQLAEAREIMDNPMVQQAIPLAYGDSYRGYRILGTQASYLEKYGAEFREGRVFSQAMQATIGADVARKTNLQLGDTFLGTHGDATEGHTHEEHPYTVVGILEKTNTVLDQLLLTNIESVWDVHDEHNHAEGDEHEHEHEDDKEITAVLLQYKTKRSVLSMPRYINEQTNMQAVLPALEINRLFYMLGVGATTLQLIAAGIMLMAAFSMFFVLYNRLKERKHELALMRSLGYRPRQLFGLLLFEGVLLAALGYAFGWLLSRAALYVVNQQAANDFNIQFKGDWVAGEGYLLLLTIMLGILAALPPAWQAMRMDVSTVLSEN